MPVSLDDLDVQMLRILQEEGRLSNSALAERVGLSEAPCWRRLKRLEQEGILSGYRGMVDRKTAGLGVFAIVNVRFSTHDMQMARAFETRIGELESVLSCHNVTGDVDYVLTVVARDLDDYARFTMTLRSLPGVTAIHTSISLREIKSSTAIPLRPNQVG